MSQIRSRRSMNRRSFLKLGSLGAAIAAGWSNQASAKTGSTAQAETPGAMYRTLGRTGLKVSVVSLGAMQTQELSVMHAAFDRGVNFVDTARAYMGGQNEHHVGRALQGYRSKIYVATKVRLGPKEQMLLSIQESLATLQLDSVDLLQLHGVRSREHVLDPVGREVLAEMRSQGKTRFVGVSTHKNEAEVIQAVVDDPEKFFDTVLVAYNFGSDPGVKEAIALAAKANIGVIAMKTQAGGYNTKELGDISPHQAALKWVLQDPNVHTTIPSMINLDQVREDTAVMGMKLTRADLDILNTYAMAIKSHYCHQCGACEATCPKGVDIPTINRCLMYAEGYGDLELARSTYTSELVGPVSAAVCGECDHCVARCARGLDIPIRMRRAQTLFA